MTSKDIPFEVEVRCRVKSNEEAYQLLPFMSSCLNREVSYVTDFYGLKLFQSGELLRVGKVLIDHDTRYFLVWKGPDIGKLANIRQELREEITFGIKNSIILKYLRGNNNISSREEVIRELDQLGHHMFMSFEGIDTEGYYEPYNIQVKLMNCRQLSPLLVEIEKTANNEEDAARCEEALLELCGQFRLEDRLIRKEPPTLLYENLFRPNSK
jgi:adenylate cyclase class IV